LDACCGPVKHEPPLYIWPCGLGFLLVLRLCGPVRGEPDEDFSVGDRAVLPLRSLRPLLSPCFLMPHTYKRKYGLDWQPEMSDFQLELWCAKKWREPTFAAGKLSDPELHMIRAIEFAFPKGNPHFTISPWTEEHCYDWCREDFCITWGCASSSKSNDYGLLAVLDWIADPKDTLTIIASTSKDMLQIRTYESVLRYFKLLKKQLGVPGMISKTRLAIVNDEADDDESTVKASIKGVAVQAGTVEEAKANLHGGHLPYVRLIGDELAQMREAFMEARHNLSIGAKKGFKLIGLCNPDSVYDLAGQYSVPLDGWGSVDENTPFWRTQWGKVRHHNGFKSPAVVMPGGDDMFPYLINQQQIDRIISEHHGNPDAPAVWTQIKGFPPPQGSDHTVLTEVLVTTFNMSDSVVWADDYKVIAGLDPAFTASGDNCILQIAEVGFSKEGRLVICFRETLALKIEASSNRPVTYQIADQVRAAMDEHGFTIDMLGVDDSGTQNVGDVLEAEIGPGLWRVNFASRASDLPVSAINNTPARDRYANRITELYYTLSEFGQRHQIRGLPPEAARQFCCRRLEARRPLRIEPKDQVKKRIKCSPDEADACAIAIGVARERLGVHPGTSRLSDGTVSVGGFNTGITLDTFRIYDIDGSESNYMTPAI